MYSCTASEDTRSFAPHRVIYIELLTRMVNESWLVFKCFETHVEGNLGGQCAPSPINWSLGQSNFAPRCAMLRMENNQMPRTLTSVGGSPLLQQGGAGPQSSANAFDYLLPVALGHEFTLSLLKGRNPGLLLLTFALAVAGHESRITPFLIGMQYD